MISSSIVVTAVSLFGSFMGFLVQVLMASRYGTGVSVDAYLYAIGTPTFLSGMVSAFFSYTIAPKLAEQLDKTKKQNQFIVSILSLSLISVIIILLASPILIQLQRNALPIKSEILQEGYIQRLFVLAWWIAGVQILVSSMSAVLMGLKRPIFATLLNLAPYAGMLACMLIATSGGIEHLAWGLLAGTTIAFLLAFYTLSGRIVCNWRDVNWSKARPIVMCAPYTLIAMTCFSAYSVIDSYWAPRGGEGVLASLGYAQRLMIALGGLAVAGPSAVIAPRFSQLVVTGNIGEFEKLFRKVLGSTFLIACSLAIMLYVGGDLIVRLLLVRGSFSQQDAEKVSEVLQYCLPGMVCMLLSAICFRIIYCFRNVEKRAAILGILWAASYFLLSGVFINLSGRGIALAYSLTWLISFIYIFALVIHYKKKRFIRSYRPV